MTRDELAELLHGKRKQLSGQDDGFPTCGTCQRSADVLLALLEPHFKAAEAAALARAVEAIRAEHKPLGEPPDEHEDTPTDYYFRIHYNTGLTDAEAVLRALSHDSGQWLEQRLAQARLDEHKLDCLTCSDRRLYLCPRRAELEAQLSGQAEGGGA